MVGGARAPAQSDAARSLKRSNEMEDRENVWHCPTSAYVLPLDNPQGAL